MLIKNDNQLPRKERNMAWKKFKQEKELDFATMLAEVIENGATPYTRQQLARKDVGV